MKRLIIFICILLFFGGNCFSEVISFDDIRNHYQTFLSKPNLENLKELSQELDLFSQSDFILSNKKKYSDLKASFNILNENVKKTLASFENPWIPENSDSDVDPNITLISDSFIDFVIQENILISRSSSQLQFTLMGLAVFIFVTALITVFISKNRREKMADILQKKYMLQGQESERRRISEELHDTIAQNLKAQKLQILNAKDNLPDGSYEKSKELTEEWNNIYNSSKDNLKGIREICQNLFPPNFTRKKIEWIVGELCQKTENKTGIKCSFTLNSGSDYDKISNEEKLHIFRILQEGINNAVAHSKCSEIKISLSKNEIILKDNGCGFNVEETMIKKTNHFGLRSILERAQIMNAKANITSNSHGTKIALRFKR